MANGIFFFKAAMLFYLVGILSDKLCAIDANWRVFHTNDKVSMFYKPESVKGKGIKNIKGFGHGDLYVVINVDIPSSLSSDEKKHFQQISKLRNDEERLEKVLKNMV